MKRIIFVIVTLVVLGGIALYNVSGKTSYTAPEVVEKTVEVKVPETEARIKEAQEAQMSAIEAEAQKAYEATKQKMLTEIELEVTRTIKKELEARELELEEEVSL